MRALFVLTPSESRRFIAKAVAQLPEVKKAKEEGEIVVGHGSTNVYVAEEILEHADGKDIDLIAMTTHGRSGVKRFLLGSVAEKVLRYSPKPIFLVRCT